VTAPVDLTDISAPMPWHREEWAHLLEQLAQEHLPQALLLAGAQHSGKSQMALAFARLLLCAEPQGLFNCGRCHACTLSARGTHGDFRWVSPQEKSRIIKVDQIREVVQFAIKTAGYGLRKVIVLTPADNMNLNAYNALLKSLEEPADNTYWILVCHRMVGVPATVRSRCQILRPALPDKEASLTWLDETTENREQSEELLALSDGRPLLAQQMYLEGNSKEYVQKRHGLQALLDGQISVPEAASLFEDGDVEGFLQNLAEALQRLSSSLPLERLKTRQGRALFSLLDEVFLLQRAVSAGANPGKQLLVETTLLKIRRELGVGVLGDTMNSQTGDVRV
jgi:DNA polymerase-3 subunit delta'